MMGHLPATRIVQGESEKGVDRCLRIFWEGDLPLGKSRSCKSVGEIESDCSRTEIMKNTQRTKKQRNA